MKILFSTALMLGLTGAAFAQYPTVPKDVQDASEAMLAEARKHSDEAWAKALPTIQYDARHGKPYIPWAARPTDLPQADMPAFPGAQGGGAFSFGGHGGRPIVVTSLEDSGPGTFREACEQARSPHHRDST